MSIMKAILATTALALTPMAASAITIAPGDSDGLNTRLQPGQEFTLPFSPTENVLVNFALSVTGRVSDLSKLTFGFSDAVTSTFTITPNGGVGAGTGFLSGTFASDFLLSVSGANIAKAVNLTIDWEAAAPAPVPLPAAGLLLGAALLGMGGVAAKRRRRGEI